MRSAKAHNNLPSVFHSSGRSMSTLTHLQRLEAESIHIFREVVAECDNPVILYYIGKDSSVLMNQAIKCICRSRLPFPVLHIDSTWKFNEMIAFRDRTAQHLGLDLLVHVNEEGRAAGVAPFAHSSGLHTDIMKNPGTKTGTRSAAASTRPSAARGATRRRRGYFLSEQRNTAGTRRPSARNSGSSTIRVRTRMNRSGSFRYTVLTAKSEILGALRP